MRLVLPITFDLLLRFICMVLMAMSVLILEKHLKYDQELAKDSQHIPGKARLLAGLAFCGMNIFIHVTRMIITLIRTYLALWWLDALLGITSITTFCLFISMSGHEHCHAWNGHFLRKIWKFTDEANICDQWEEIQVFSVIVSHCCLGLSMMSYQIRLLDCMQTSEEGMKHPQHGEPKSITSQLRLVIPYEWNIIALIPKIRNFIATKQAAGKAGETATQAQPMANPRNNQRRAQRRAPTNLQQQNSGTGNPSVQPPAYGHPAQPQQQVNTAQQRIQIPPCPQGVNQREWVQYHIQQARRSTGAV